MCTSQIPNELHPSLLPPPCLSLSLPHFFPSPLPLHTRVSSGPDWPQTHCVTNFWCSFLHLLRSWKFRQVPPTSGSVGAGNKPRASCLPRKPSTNWPGSPAPAQFCLKCRHYIHQSFKFPKNKKSSLDILRVHHWMRIYLANIRKLSLKFKEHKFHSLKTVYLTKFKELKVSLLSSSIWKKISVYLFSGLGTYQWHASVKQDRWFSGRCSPTAVWSKDKF